MDDQGNILVKRVSKCNVYVKSTAQGDETAIGNDVLKLPNCALELEKPVKVRGWLAMSPLESARHGVWRPTLSAAVDLPSAGGSRRRRGTRLRENKRMSR